MKFLITIFIAFCAIASATNVSENTPGKITAGVLARIAAYPFGARWWLNGAISGKRKTNDSFTPQGINLISLSLFIINF